MVELTIVARVSKLLLRVSRRERHPNPASVGRLLESLSQKSLGVGSNPARDLRARFSHFTYAYPPADISWNQPFKSRQRRAWVDHITDSVASDSRPYVYKPPSRERVIEWVAEAWSGLSKETIQSGFVRAKFPVEGRRVVTEELDSDNVAEILESLCLIDTNFSDLESDDDLSCDEASEEDSKGTKDSEGAGVDVEMSECYM
uniref:AlNc14C19G1965 protein n=1 Tax=Albugo laibachii Nc14 TaxID=890382 RepID=F0W4Z5_9STRA|nr:AlNc14C19G1965 [Albugo laibachii Nc14]|eukprot:CCA16185.1 AlNc14C19G1965 [Albugo laibachii Nc14]